MANLSAPRTTSTTSELHVPGVIFFLPYNSCLCLAGFGQVLCGVGGSVDKSIDKKSCTISAAAMPVISAAAAVRS